MNTSQFFYRTVIFSRQGEQISLVDINQTEESTPLESWFAVVVSLADGKHTIADLINFLSQQYRGAPPATLPETINSVIERLCEGKLIQLSDEAVDLPYYLANSVEEMDTAKAKQLIKADGYTQH